MKHIKKGILASVFLVGALFFLHHINAFALYNADQPTLDADGGAEYTDYQDVPATQLPPESIPPNTPSNATSDVSSQNVNYSGTVSGYQSWSTQLNVTLWYAWNRALNGLFPSSDTATNGYATALANPNVTIGYDYGVFDAANPSTRIPEGSTIPLGKQVILRFQPYTSDNIFWFGTGYSMDSPYGEWRANAAAPSRSGNQVTCDSKDLTASYSGFGLTFDTYIPFVVNPPSRSLSNTSGLTCGPLTSNPDGSQSALCTATGTGSFTPTFNYDSTYGKFYYRYYDYRDMTSIGWGTAGCYGNNIPLAQGSSSAGPDANYSGSVQQGYVVSIPSQAFTYPLNVAVTGNPPTKPTISCTSSVLVGQDVSMTLTSTDPDNDKVQYGADWIDDGNQQVNSGWTDLVPSGTSQTLTKSGGYSTAGTYTLYGWARDQNQNMSEPSSCTVTVSDAAKPNLTAGAVSPTTATAGTAVTLSAGIQNVGGVATPAGFTDLFQRATDSSGSGATDIGTYANGVLAANGSNAATLAYTFPSAGTYYVRACADKSSAGDPGVITESNESDNCGDWTAVTVSAVVPLAPTATLTSADATVPTTLTWSCTNSTTSTGAGFSTGGATSGSTPVSVDGTYSVTCTGAGGSATATATVGPHICTNPSATLAATPDRIQVGQGSVIAYSNISGVNGSCTLSGPGINQTFAASSCTVPSGSAPTGPLTTQSTYILTCDGVERARAVVNVVPKFKEF